MKQQSIQKSFERKIVLTDDQKNRLANIYKHLDFLSQQPTQISSKPEVEDLDKTKVISC